MGDVVAFHMAAEFVVAPPRRALTAAERPIAAHGLIAATEGPLRLEGKPGTGHRLIARSALVGLAHIIGAEAAAEAAEDIAGELRRAALIGWCPASADNVEPEPAA